MIYSARQISVPVGTILYSTVQIMLKLYRIGTYPNKVPVPVVLLFKTYCRYIKKLISNEPKKPTP